MIIASEQKDYTKACLQYDHQWAISCDDKYPAVQAQIWRNNRPNLILVSQVDFFYLQ